tara:strand:- start:2479 stop:4179 length:1701 start_codon:yes stop_codon:yes gene_type:complete
MAKIVSVSFEKLDSIRIKQVCHSYNSQFPSEKRLSHINGEIVLPLNCYPHIVQKNGRILRDKLEGLYKKLHRDFNRDSGDKDNIKNSIREEILLRWKGKFGRWRKDICGKRCNHTARSVLSPNPKLELYQVGLPVDWKKTLLVEDTYDVHCDIIAVLRNERKFHPKFCKPKKGDVILRQLNEGDLVLVNRQPTLRESNLVAMEVVWHDKKTIQMHPGVFSMFDADCDGDEINIHLPQVGQELLKNMHITKSIWNLGDMTLSPSIIQDAVVGLCLNENDFKLNEDIHNDPRVILNRMKKYYDKGTHVSFQHGFTIGFDFSEIDYMIKTGAKGKKAHSGMIRKMLKGIYDNNEHFLACQEARIAMISTSLKTADTGYISRRMAYHFDDVIQENGMAIDYQLNSKRICSVPNEFRHIKNIGAYMVTVFMPPLTQKMLDSFHTAAVGESSTNTSHKFQELLNCTSLKMIEIYSNEGIEATKDWIRNELQKEFVDLHQFWVDLLIEYILITGKPIGIGMTSLKKRVCYEDTKVMPIFKLCKFGSPLKHLEYAVEKGISDNLTSYHSSELFC